MNLENMPFENILKQNFLLSGFRKGQKEIISAILNKKDVLAVLPTGGGKSLCYQFPTVYTKKLVIVISPLIALMKDQVTSLAKLGIPAACLCSGQTESEKREVFFSINKGGPFILYLSPERIQKQGFQKWILDKDVALFAVDEAHCVSQWGHDFREEYSQLQILKTLRPDVPILALTASATPTVLKDVAKHLHLKKPERMVHGFYRPNLYYQVEFCENNDSKILFVRQALKQTPKGRVLIYCGTRKATEELCHYLQEDFDKVSFYHAGLSTEERTKVQESYMQGDLRILTATNAFGMGVDQSDVRLVLHYQMPANIDSLYQEMGRAGRDGKESTCLMLYSKKDKGLQSHFIYNSEAPQIIKNARWNNLEALVNYSESGECRHAEILTYYKDSQRIYSCGHCDVCDASSTRRIQKPEISKVTKIKQKQSKDVVILNDAQEECFLRLKAWRKNKAFELDVPAFVVFSDRTLRSIATENPQSLEELKNIHGIGPAKLEQFGWDVLAEITQPRY